MLEWLQEHPGWVVWASSSLVLMVAGILAVPFALARMPRDFFTRRPGAGRKPPLWLNILGCVLIVAGAAMLLLPGPGAVTLIAGIGLMDFPGRRKILHALLGHGRILERFNRLRAKWHKPPLKKP